MATKSQIQMSGSRDLPGLQTIYLPQISMYEANGGASFEGDWGAVASPKEKKKRKKERKRRKKRKKGKKKERKKGTMNNVKYTTYKLIKCCFFPIFQ